MYLGIGKMRVGEGRAEVGADLTLLLPPFTVKMDWGEFRWLRQISFENNVPKQNVPFNLIYLS